MRMSKRIKVCETIEEAIAAQEIGALLWYRPSLEEWCTNPYDPCVDDELSQKDEQKYIDHRRYGYYVEDDNEEVQ